LYPGLVGIFRKEDRKKPRLKVELVVGLVGRGKLFYVSIGLVRPCEA
jgi:hypothetical protein